MYLLAMHDIFTLDLLHRAIAALAAVKVRRQTTKNDDIDDSLEILEKTFEIPQNFLVKIR